MVSVFSPKGRVLPILAVLAVIVVLWYLLAIALNYARVSEMLAADNPDYTTAELIKGTWNMERPVLPAPDQIARDLWKSTVTLNPASKRSLLYHTYVTASATLVGFIFGAILGMVLAAEFSAQLGMISAGDAARVERHLASVGLPTHLQDIAGFAQEGLKDADTLMALMAQDKKVKRGRLTFILLEAVGRAVIANDVEPARVREFLAEKLARRP
jgi:hypothetical protein